MTEETVKESYFNVNDVSPKEGVRLVYYPKDSADLEFFSPYAHFTSVNDYNKPPPVETEFIA
jgi:hypothetical protein